jgi:solute carrier family 45 protein 1/2/4
VLGLHNVAVVIPQFLVTALSSLIFAIMEPKSGSGDSPTSADGSPADAPVGQRSDALGIVFRLGGCCALVAGILAVRLVRRYGNELRG